MDEKAEALKALSDFVIVDIAADSFATSSVVSVIDSSCRDSGAKLGLI